jgi:hypothetical protein
LDFIFKNQILTKTKTDKFNPKTDKFNPKTDKFNPKTDKFNPKTDKFNPKTDKESVDMSAILATNLTTKPTKRDHSCVVGNGANHIKIMWGLLA